MTCETARYAESIVVLVAAVLVLVAHTYRLHRANKAANVNGRRGTTAGDGAKKRIRYVAMLSSVLLVAHCVDLNGCFWNTPMVVVQVVRWLNLGGIAVITVEVAWSALYSGYAAVKLTTPKPLYRVLMIISCAVWVLVGIETSVVDSVYNNDDLTGDKSQRDRATAVTTASVWAYWAASVLWFLLFGIVVCYFLLRVYLILSESTVSGSASASSDAGEGQRVQVNRARVIRRRTLHRGLVAAMFAFCATLTSTFQLITVLNDPEAVVADTPPRAFINVVFPTELLMAAFLMWIFFIAYPGSLRNQHAHSHGHRSHTNATMEAGASRIASDVELGVHVSDSDEAGAHVEFEASIAPSTTHTSVYSNISTEHSQRCHSHSSCSVSTSQCQCERVCS